MLNCKNLFLWILSYANAKVKVLYILSRLINTYLSKPGICYDNKSTKNAEKLAFKPKNFYLWITCFETLVLKINSLHLSLTNYIKKDQKILKNFSLPFKMQLEIGLTLLLRIFRFKNKTRIFFCLIKHMMTFYEFKSTIHAIL